MKKIVGLLLAFCVVIGVMPISFATANEDQVLTSGIYSYVVLSEEMSRIGKKGVVIISVNDQNATSIIIPDTIDGYPVTLIDMRAFENTQITDVTLPSSIAAVGTHTTSNYNSQYHTENIFADSKLKNVHIGENKYYYSIDGVLFDAEDKELIFYPRNSDRKTYTIPQGTVGVGYDAMKEAINLEEIIVPQGVKYINNAGFAGCLKLKNVVIHEGLTIIEGHVFNSCENLETITLPKSLEVLKTSNYVFYECNSLKDIYYNGSLESWNKIKNSRFSDSCEKEIDDNVTIHFEELSVCFDDGFLPLDQPPVLVNGRTLVPARFIFEAMGMSVGWNSDTQTVTATGANNSISLKIGQKEAIVNGQTRVMDEPAQIINGRTLVPVRFVSEVLLLDVIWNNDEQTVYIRNNGNIHLAEMIYQGYCTTTYVPDRQWSIRQQEDIEELYKKYKRVDKIYSVGFFALDFVNIAEGASDVISALKKESSEFFEKLYDLQKDMIEQVEESRSSSGSDDYVRVADCYATLGLNSCDSFETLTEELEKLHQKRTKTGYFTYEQAVAYLTLYYMREMDKNMITAAGVILDKELPDNLLQAAWLTYNEFRADMLSEPEWWKDVKHIKSIESYHEEIEKYEKYIDNMSNGKRAVESK